MKMLMGSIAVLTGLLCIGGCMEAGESMDKIEKAAAAKVTIDQAITTASDKVAGTVIEAELEKKHDKLVWEVEVVTAENKVMEVHIDAASGEVIATEEK
jgi:uncharacterized membrane protein YkoI